MERGQYFGEIELVTGGENLATIRASSDQGATVTMIDKEAFDNLLAASEATRTEISQVVQDRIIENVSKTSEAAADEPALAQNSA